MVIPKPWFNPLHLSFSPAQPLLNVAACVWKMILCQKFYYLVAGGHLSNLPPWAKTKWFHTWGTCYLTRQGKYVILICIVLCYKLNYYHIPLPNIRYLKIYISGHWYYWAYWWCFSCVLPKVDWTSPPNYSKHDHGRKKIRYGGKHTRTLPSPVCSPPAYWIFIYPWTLCHC